jgi:hypothetical protein
MRLQLGSGHERTPTFLDARQHALREEVIDALTLAAQVGGGLGHAQVGRVDPGGLIVLALKERDNAAGDPLDVILGELQLDVQLAGAGDRCSVAVYVFIPSPILGDALRGGRGSPSRGATRERIAPGRKLPWQVFRTAHVGGGKASGWFCDDPQGQRQDPLRPAGLVVLKDRERRILFRPKR